MDNEIVRQLIALHDLWNRIEERAKRAEHFREEAITASINEMRYAGRRVVDVLYRLYCQPETPQNRDTIFEDLIVAKNYLVNADHDLTDSIFLLVQRRVNRTIRVHGENEIKTRCPSFASLYPVIRAAEELVAASRKDRQRRDEEYQKLNDEHLPKLMQLYEEIVKEPKLGVGDRNWIALRRWAVFVRRLVVVSSVAAIVGVILTLIAWILPWDEFQTDVSRLFHPKVTTTTAPPALTPQSPTTPDGRTPSTNTP